MFLFFIAHQSPHYLEQCLIHSRHSINIDICWKNCGVQVAHQKRWPTLSATGNMQIKTTVKYYSYTLVVVQVPSHVQLFVAPWTAAYQASLSLTIWSLPKLMAIESVMPSNHLILCCPLFLLPSIFASIGVFFSESAVRVRWPKYWSFSFSISFQWVVRTDFL